MLKLTKSLAAWQTPEFVTVFKREVAELGPNRLPLQAALLYSSHVAEVQYEAVVLAREGSDTSICIKTGIFFSGLIAGSCCADDPTPAGEQAEYCELQFIISKVSADTHIVPLPS